MDENKAKELALKEVATRGKDPARYDVTAREEGEEWAVEIVGKEPRPPGDEFMIYVDKNTGKLRVMQGE
ncbi:MAG: hypothetical protein R3B48_16120 [Kofleriaceae bacterium]